MLLKYCSIALFAGIAIARPAAPNPKDHVVHGKVFDRFVIIWNENTDIDDAQSNEDLNWLASQGIRLNNYFAVTHPSEPNYVSCVGGDYFGMQNDDLNRIPSNVSTIVDLLEDKGISWAEYQEDMPYTGFQGFEQRNAQGDKDYVRKHNPLVIYDSVANKPDRLNNIKNFTKFYEDLKADKLPQWMFITPNMTNDGHDSTTAVLGAWSRRFLTPLLKDKNFMEKTLVMLTFDENDTYEKRNRVDTILLGDVIPKHLHGTTDDNYYTHYSEISTIEANWDLHTLGRYDVGANVLAFVGEKTGDKIRQPSNQGGVSNIYNNVSYAGAFNSDKWAPMPVPNTSLKHNGRTVLPAIQQTWGNEQDKTTYKDSVDVPSGFEL